MRPDHDIGADFGKIGRVNVMACGMESCMRADAHIISYDDPTSGLVARVHLDSAIDADPAPNLDKPREFDVHPRVEIHTGPHPPEHKAVSDAA
jgi:hypothetical protein